MKKRILFAKSAVSPWLLSSAVLENSSPALAFPNVKIQKILLVANQKNLVCRAPRASRANLLSVSPTKAAAAYFGAVLAIRNATMRPGKILLPKLNQTKKLLMSARQNRKF